MGAQGTIAWGIDGNNIVGSYIDASGFDHGFLYDFSTYTTLDDPAGQQVSRFGFGPTGSDVRGISGNTIVGIYTTTGRENGYIATVPEPTTLSLIALATGSLLARRRKR